MSELTLHHLGRRLEHSLKLIRKGYEHKAYDLVVSNDSVSLNEGVQINQVMDNQFETFKPILRPLSDLTKLIKHKGDEFVPIYILWKPTLTPIYDIKYNSWIKTIHLMNYQQIKLLLQWHFVIDEPEGTWIDVNTLDANPYE